MDTADGFAEFVRPHWAAMTRLARRLGGPDWEDVVQDALTAAWRKRDRFDPGRGSPRSWLLTLTADQARKALRRGRSTVTLADDDGRSAGGSSPPNCGAADLDLARAVASLSPRQRLVVELFYFLDLPVADVAMVMDCSPGTVKSTLSDARDRLRDKLGKDYS